MSRRAIIMQDHYAIVNDGDQLLGTVEKRQDAGREWNLWDWYPLDGDDGEYSLPLHDALHKALKK